MPDITSAVSKLALSVAMSLTTFAAEIKGASGATPAPIPTPGTTPAPAPAPTPTPAGRLQMIATAGNQLSNDLSSIDSDDQTGHFIVRPVIVGRGGSYTLWPRFYNRTGAMWPVDLGQEIVIADSFIVPLTGGNAVPVLFIGRASAKIAKGAYIDGDAIKPEQLGFKGKFPSGLIGWEWTRVEAPRGGYHVDNIDLRVNYPGFAGYSYNAATFNAGAYKPGILPSGMQPLRRGKCFGAVWCGERDDTCEAWITNGDSWTHGTEFMSSMPGLESDFDQKLYGDFYERGLVDPDTGEVEAFLNSGFYGGNVNGYREDLDPSVPFYKLATDLMHEQGFNMSGGAIADTKRDLLAVVTTFRKHSPVGRVMRSKLLGADLISKDEFRTVEGQLFRVEVKPGESFTDEIGGKFYKPGGASMPGGNFRLLNEWIEEEGRKGTWEVLTLDLVRASTDRASDDYYRWKADGRAYWMNWGNHPSPWGSTRLIAKEMQALLKRRRGSSPGASAPAPTPAPVPAPSTGITTPVDATPAPTSSSGITRPEDGVYKPPHVPGIDHTPILAEYAKHISDSGEQGYLDLQGKKWDIYPDANGMGFKLDCSRIIMGSKAKATIRMHGKFKRAIEISQKIGRGDDAIVGGSMGKIIENINFVDMDDSVEHVLHFENEPGDRQEFAGGYVSNLNFKRGKHQIYIGKNAFFVGAEYCYFNEYRGSPIGRGYDSINSGEKTSLAHCVFANGRICHEVQFANSADWYYLDCSFDFPYDRFANMVAGKHNFVLCHFEGRRTWNMDDPNNPRSRSPFTGSMGFLAVFTMCDFSWVPNGDIPKPEYLFEIGEGGGTVVVNNCWPGDGFDLWAIDADGRPKACNMPDHLTMTLPDMINGIDALNGMHTWNAGKPGWL